MKVPALQLLLAYCALARQPALPPGFEHARALYFQAVEGDKKAFEEAGRLFDQLHRQNRQPQVEVYYGSLRLLEAARTWALWKKNALSKEGIQAMDEAVGTAPGDLEVRFIRAATTYDLPAFFGRRKQSEQDFSLLAKQAAEAARSGALEPRLAAASLYYHGEFLHRSGENSAATAAWKQAIALAPRSRAARESREALSKRGG